MPDHRRGTEQEHMECYLTPSDIVCIKMIGGTGIGGTIHHLGGITIWSKCTRPPLGGGGGYRS